MQSFSSSVEKYFMSERSEQENFLISKRPRNVFFII